MSNVILLVLVLGMSLSSLLGLFEFKEITFHLAKPVFVQPVFTWSTLLAVGLPLFIVTTTSQNIPGTAILKANGFEPPISRLISWIGAANLGFAPFGCYSINLAAITAAICMGNEADKNPRERYKATIFAGICWIIIGLLGATVVTLFSSFPKPLILTIAGLALLSTIGNALKVALEVEAHRESALITVLSTASGFSLFGVGAGFWGLMLGVSSLLLSNLLKKEALLPKTI